MYPTTASLNKKDIEQLAKAAFYQHLISGYGDSEYPDKYQIIYKGKTRHFSLAQARFFLRQLLALDWLEALNYPNS